VGFGACVGAGSDKTLKYTRASNKQQQAVACCSRRLPAACLTTLPHNIVLPLMPACPAAAAAAAAAVLSIQHRWASSVCRACSSCSPSVVAAVKTLHTPLVSRLPTSRHVLSQFPRELRLPLVA
jgi:hypothetical protein